ARAQRTRQAIIDAAAARFGAEGYRSATIAAIAADAGVTDAGLLYHFPTKEDLLFAVMKSADIALQAVLEERRHLGGLDFIRAMRDWGELMEREAPITAMHTILSAEHLLDDSRINTYFRTRYETANSDAVAALEEARRRGQLRDGVDIEAEARLFLAVMDGARLQYFFSDGEVSMATLVRQYVDTMVERLSA
ncbi:MAG: TetR family transcriptional regulator, partial [Ilumatobacteraceae bacterium]